MLGIYFKNIYKLCLFLIILFCGNSYSQEYIILANEESTEYRIMVGSQATETEVFAAQELQGYLLQISGAFMPMAYENEKAYKNLILVGKNAARLMLPESTFDQLKNDDFIIKVIGDRLILSGNSSRGTLYSVYAFLESLGCRWFAPGVIGEVIPRLSRIALTNINHIEKPSIKYRGFMCLFENTCQSINWIDWMAKNRLNYAITSQASFETFNNALLAEAKKRGIYVGVRISTDENSLEQITNFINNSPNLDMIEIVASDVKLAFLLKEIYKEKIISIVIKGRSAIPNNQGFKNHISFSYESDMRCYRHLLDDQSCQMNHDYRLFIEKVVTGKTQFKRPVFIHEYYMGSYEQNSFPFPILNCIAGDIRYFFQNGIDGVISQSEIGNWGTYGLNYYVFSKMVWNSAYNLGTIIDDYCEKYYGTASKYMRKYYAIFEEAVGSMEHLQYLDSPEKILSIVNEKILHEMEMQIENAKSVANDVTIFDRIRKVQISFDYMKLVWQFFYFYSSASQSSKNKNDIQKDLQVVIESGERLLKHLVNNVDEEVFIVTESYVLDLIEPIIADARARLQ